MDGERPPVSRSDDSICDIREFFKQKMSFFRAIAHGDCPVASRSNDLEAGADFLVRLRLTGRESVRK